MIKTIITAILSVLFVFSVAGASVADETGAGANAGNTGKHEIVKEKTKEKAKENHEKYKRHKKHKKDTK